MFNLNATSADAKTLQANAEQNLDGREAEIVEFIREKIVEIAQKVGGYVAISGGGHINPTEGEHGDQVWLSVASLPKPDAATQSGQNPPEGSVALPQQSDGSSLATPTAVPQPDPGLAREQGWESPEPDPSRVQYSGIGGNVMVPEGAEEQSAPSTGTLYSGIGGQGRDSDNIAKQELGAENEPEHPAAPKPPEE